MKTSSTEQKNRSREMSIEKLDLINKAQRERYKTDPVYRKKSIASAIRYQQNASRKKFDDVTSLLDDLSQDAEFRDLLINMGK